MKDLKPAILMLIIFSVICGGIYPTIVTGIAQVLFPAQANGSFLSDKSGREIGSRLIGQPFSSPRYFWPRPSATPVFGYNPEASGGSNAGPTNPDYLQKVAERVKALHDSGISDKIPAELVQASASGLDPHLTPEAARVQIPRVAKSRAISEADLGKIVAAATSDRQFGLLGEPRVNVLELNCSLDRLEP